jgi:hypothetical protein
MSVVDDIRSAYIPSNALVESRSMVASLLIVNCGIPTYDDGDAV